MLTSTQAECQGRSFIAFLNEAVQYEGVTCTRCVALTFEAEISDDPEALADVACMPTLLPGEFDGEPLDGDLALARLRLIHLEQEYPTGLSILR